MRRAVQRAATALATLVVVLAVVFGLLHALPGDPVAGSTDESLGPRLAPEHLEEMRRTYRLDQPVPRQFVLWLADVARGDLGHSFRDRRPVGRTIVERIGPTLALNLAALALTIGIGVPLGALAAERPGSRSDRWTAVAGYALYAVPVFWAALVLQSVFAVQLDVLPLQGLSSDAIARHGPIARALDRLAHLVLPATSLAYAGAAYVARFVRANLLDAALPDAARAARARGVGPWAVLVRHGIRQASVPLLTLAGFLIPSLVGGSVLIETVFNIPGIGLLFFDAVHQRDFPVVLGVTLLSGVATLIGIVVADLLYAVVDPRVRRA